MKKLFVTSTGTNIGKTLIVCALSEVLKKTGFKVKILKPVISGFNFDDIPNDISQICNSLETDYSKKNIKEITRYFFKEPLSPDMAARGENKNQVKINEIVKFIYEAADNNKEKIDYLFIEGVGGVNVPLNDKETIIDLIPKISDSNILICGSYLGSLSHTISAYQNLVAKNIKPKLVVVTENLNQKDELYIPAKETVKSLENFISSPILGIENIESDNNNLLLNSISEKLKRSKIDEFF